MALGAWGLRAPEPELAAVWRRQGFWGGETLGSYVDRLLGRFASSTFTFRSDTRPWNGSYGDVRALSRRAAQGLRRRGVGPGDVVAFQLPNWVEAAITFYAVCYLDAIVVPIVHTYGPKEVSYILRRTNVDLFVTADRFGRTDFLEHLASTRGDVDRVVVVGAGAAPASTERFDALLEEPPLGVPDFGDPGEPSLVAYTSGTTADPKGVIHSDRSVLSEVAHMNGMRAGGIQAGRRPNLVGAPLGHAAGMYGTLLTPLDTGTPVHVVDRWDPELVLAAMAEDGLSAGSGVTYFLTSLLDHPDCTPAHHALIGSVGMGGAAVPPAVADRAAALGIALFRSYGSTEHPSITGASGDDPPDKCRYTDGRPLRGVEIRLVGEDGRPVAQGESGEILSRGPDLFLGYTDPALTAEALDAEGWYATGDVGRLDEDGYLTIVDRKKDIIIRGGENISALEVEEVLLRMPGILEAAVVAAPDRRLGEHACAFVRVAGTTERTPTLASMRRHLESAGLGRQKWPEELRLVEELPRTPSGKVRKADLRQRLLDEQPGVSRPSPGRS